MDQNYKREIPIRVDFLILAGLVAAIGWLSASFFMAKVAPNDFPHTVAELFLEFCKTFCVAGFISFFLDRVLKNLFPEGESARFARSGITNIYATRRAGAADISSCVNGASHIDIMGISLRDFLGQNIFSDVWRAIEKRLIHEEEYGVPIAKRLRVRLLMLHPNSSEGLFRFNFEQTQDGGDQSNLIRDVGTGLAQVQHVRAEIHRAGKGNNVRLDEAGMLYTSQFLDVRLYHHCPFSLLFLTDKHCFVEQYYYKNHGSHVDLPMLRYAKQELLGEFHTSFEEIWKHAKPGVLNEGDVGTAKAIDSCAIRNIFDNTQRSQSGIRQARAMANCGSGATIRILSISGKFYREPSVVQELLDASARGASIQFLLLNPICVQAVLRAVADNHPLKISSELSKWNWAKHCGTDLFKDTSQHILELTKRIKDGLHCEVHLHHSAPSCSLLLTPEKAFVEQYIYGRSEVKIKNQVLGGEYPLFEFGLKDSDTRQDTSELQMLSSTFDIIWKSYSIDLAAYSALDEEVQFKTTLADLSRWSST